MFVLRTLAAIHRQNVKLAAFYDSRRDYLEARGNIEGLTHQELLEVFYGPEWEPSWPEKLRGVGAQRPRTSTTDGPKG